MRHGNTFEAGQTPLQVGAKTDLPLTAYGRAQAESMAAYLQAQHCLPTAIYAGDLKRQLEFAQIIGDQFGLKVQKASALTEVDYGLWEGLSSKAILARFPEEYTEWIDSGKWQGRIFGGSKELYLKHLDQWISYLTETFYEGTVLAVTSNGILRFLKNQKVQTGHFCEMDLSSKERKICSWNQNPGIHG